MLHYCDIGHSDLERLEWIETLDDMMGDNLVQFKQPDGILVITKAGWDEFLYETADEIVCALQGERPDECLKLRWHSLIKSTLRAAQESIIRLFID